jgi:hypothetical protein
VSRINTLFPGRLDVSNSPVSNGTVSITWTGISAPDSDFTDAGLSTGLFLDLPAAINNDLTVSFTANGTSTFARSFVTGASGSDFFFPFASFTDDTVFSNVTTLVMTLTSSLAAWDAQVDLIETRPRPVPAPGTLGLLGLGLLGIGVRRFKRG